MKKPVFIAHQLSGNLEANLQSAKMWCRWAIFVRDINPIAPYLTLMAILDEKDKNERDIGLGLGDEYIPTCDELWICGPKPSTDSYVWEEVEIAKFCHVIVVDYTDLILPENFH
jgi:hypothetical protein